MVVIGGAKFNADTIKKISWDNDTKKWNFEPNDVNYCDAVRMKKLGFFTTNPFCMSKENPSENPDFPLKNKIMDYSKPRAWITGLKEGGCLYEYIGKIDYFEFDGNHSPGVCYIYIYIYSKAYIIVTYYIYNICIGIRWVY